MTASLLMLIGAIALVVGVIACMLNAVSFVKSDRGFGGAAVIHLLFGFIAWLGGLCLIGGFIWFLCLVIAKEVRGEVKPEQPKVEVAH